MADIKIHVRYFFHFNLTADEGKLQAITDDEFQLLCAYEFYAQSPDGQYDDVACDCIAERLFERGLYLEPKQ